MFGFGRRKYDPATQHDVHVLHRMIEELRRAHITLMNHVLKKEDEMANDLTALQAAVARLEETVSHLPPPTPDQQPAIDDLTTRVDAVNTTLTPTPPTT